MQNGDLETTQVIKEEDVPSSQPLIDKKRKMSDIMNELSTRINETRESISQMDQYSLDITEDAFFSNIERELSELKKACTLRISEIKQIQSKTEKTVKRILEKGQLIDRIYECESVGCENNSLNIKIHAMKNCQHGICSDCYLANQQIQDKINISCPICNK
jgi:hypothetical protein